MLKDYRAEDALDLLPNPLDNAENYKKILGIYLDKLQELFDVQNTESVMNTNINRNFGKNLEDVGGYVGAKRSGRSDADYRRHIVNTISRNIGSGTPEDLYSYIRNLLSPYKQTIFEYQPASFWLDIQSPSSTEPTTILNDVDKVAGAGVDTMIVSVGGRLGLRPLEDTNKDFNKSAGQYQAVLSSDDRLGSILPDDTDTADSYENNFKSFGDSRMQAGEAFAHASDANTLSSIEDTNGVLPEGY